MTQVRNDAGRPWSGRDSGADDAQERGGAGARGGEPERPKGRGGIAFLREFLKAPVELGTCFTSSKALARAMVSGLGLETAQTVIELGPGTGAITEEVLRRIPKGCRFFAIERNAGLVRELRRRWPDLSVHQDDARNLRAICEREGVRPGEVDVVVNSLPFLLFPEELQDEILRETAAVLRPGGRFTLITYRIEGLMPSVRKFRRLMERHFSDVRLRRRVLQNMPPASVYWCTR
jgi:phosphatidylethanolamine/phosphatidyl-N-methylethanolamine N-methyltransferase